jgi:hypothetical protein
MSAAGRRAFSQPLDLALKGGRDYLHGTDILPACLQVLQREYGAADIADIDIAFHGLARKSLTLCAGAAPDVGAKARLGCVIDGVREKFVLAEDGREIVERVAYAEEAIVSATDIDVGTATATSVQPLSFTSIERWVAMVKALHHALYPALPGRWLFVRGKFKYYRAHYDAASQHAVVVEANFNDKLTRSALLVDGQKLGDIFFSLE